MHLVSLGSSFASGPGIPPCTHRIAFRSGINYPSHLAKNLKADKHTDLTVAGATLLNLISEPIRRIPAQVIGLPGDADIVTITAGGNDLGYIPGLMRGTFSQGLIGRVLGVKEDLALEVPRDEEIVKRFHTLYDAIRNKAPQAKIVVIGYPVVLGSHSTTHNTHLSEEKIAHYKSIGEKLESLSAEACRGQQNVTYISIWKESAEHVVGSPDTWMYGPENVIRGFIWGGPIAWHPTPHGMEQIAQCVYPHIVKLAADL